MTLQEYARAVAEAVLDEVLPHTDPRPAAAAIDAVIATVPKPAPQHHAAPTCDSFERMRFQNLLWDAINRYATSCGGDPSDHVYGNTSRQQAVASVNNAVRDFVLPPDSTSLAPDVQAQECRDPSDDAAVEAVAREMQVTSDLWVEHGMPDAGVLHSAIGDWAQRIRARSGAQACKHCGGEAGAHREVSEVAGRLAWEHEMEARGKTVLPPSGDFEDNSRAEELRVNLRRLSEKAAMIQRADVQAQIDAAVAAELKAMSELAYVALRDAGIHPSEAYKVSRDLIRARSGGKE